MKGLRERLLEKSASNLLSAAEPTLILPVGSRPAGNGRWGHSDLAGGVYEWAFDVYVSPAPGPCIDCASTLGSSEREVRGDDWWNSDVAATSRAGSAPSAASIQSGARCVRSALQD